MRVENHTGINKWIAPLAIKALRHAMTSQCDRFEPGYHKPFAEQFGHSFDLKDPAVSVFLSALPFLPHEKLSVYSIDQGIKRLAVTVTSGFTYWKPLYPAVAALCDLRAGSGWAELDKLIYHCCGESWSHFFDSVQLIRHPEDPALGADSSCRIMFLAQGSDGYTAQVVDWFAAASEIKYLAPLLELIENGIFTVTDPFRPDHPVVVTEIRLMKDDEVMLCLPVDHTASKSMEANWSACECLSQDASFYVELMKALSPSKSVHLKGNVLEDALL